MTPEQYAARVVNEWENQYYRVCITTLEELIAAAIREHEAEARQDERERVAMDATATIPRTVCHDCGKLFLWKCNGNDLWCPECVRERETRIDP